MQLDGLNPLALYLRICPRKPCTTNSSYVYTSPYNSALPDSAKTTDPQWYPPTVYTLQITLNFNSLILFVIPFATSFVSTFPFCSLYVVPSILNRFDSSLPFVTSSPSFQRFHPVHFTSSFHVNAFMSLIPSFFKVWHAVCLPLPFFQVVHFVTSFVFQLLHPVRFPLPFVSSRSFRYTSFLYIVSSLTSASFTSSFPLTRPFHRVRPFVATLRFDSLLLSLSFQLFATVPYTSFLSF